MRIDSGAISLSSYSSQTTIIHRLNSWIHGSIRRVRTPQQQLNIDIGALKGLKVQDVSTFDISDKDKMKILLLNIMIEALTGKKMHFYIPEKYRKLASGRQRTVL